MAINSYTGCKNRSHITTSVVKSFKMYIEDGKYYCEVVFNVICPICIEMGYTETEPYRNKITKEMYDAWMKSSKSGSNIINGKVWKNNE